MALEPDEYGTVFSGCAWRDLERMRFFFFYTASEGYTQWSVDAGNPHT